MTPLDERIQRLVREQVAIVPYDPRWPGEFLREKVHLEACLPRELIGRIEHFGSTAVPGVAAKPIIDMLVEVADLAETRRRIVPVLESRGYEYFWRPTRGDDTPPFYAWFIKRDAKGRRTHHIHMVERHFPHWERLLFRDYLRAHPETVRAYVDLKTRLATDHSRDRVAYTEGKTVFIREVTQKARIYFGEGGKGAVANREDSHPAPGQG